MSAYLKAVVAAVIGAVVAIGTAWQIAAEDGGVDNAEWGQILTVVLGAVATVIGVYRAKNAPAA